MPKVSASANKAIPQQGGRRLQQSSDVFFLLVGAMLVFAVHGGFEFLEIGTLRHKSQANALAKILVDFAISTVSYFFIGYWVAYGVSFLAGAGAISGGAEGFGQQGVSLVKFFFLCTFAAAIPAIVSSGIAERAKFGPQCVATAVLVGVAYPLLEGTVWNRNFGLQDGLFKGLLGADFHDFAGSVVVHDYWRLSFFSALVPGVTTRGVRSACRRPQFLGWQ